jgi:hypothetical protein
MGANNGVDLYRITDTTRIPGSNREEIVSGLLAIPQLDPDRALPMVSWQHGTIFEPGEAPSCSVVALAGNGFIAAAASVPAWLVAGGGLNTLWLAQALQTDPRWTPTG